MIQFRNLNPDEVDVRIGSIGKNGEWITLLLYKDARCDMSILDETVGPENWQRDHFECKGNLYCKVGINTNYKDAQAVDRWIWKADCGAESRTEAEKGEASDSFKRACVYSGTVPLDLTKVVGLGAANTQYQINCEGAFRTVITGTYYGIQPVSIHPINPILSLNSWENIAKAAATGEAQEYWEIGDEKDIELSTGEILTAQIWGYSHDDLADESGKANITFGLKNLMDDKYEMNDPETNVGGWESSDMRSYMETILNTFPSDIKLLIKPVHKKSTIGNESTQTQTTSDSLWIPSCVELNSSTTEDGYKDEGSPYQIFTNYQSRIKRLSNGSGATSQYWTRSPQTSTSTLFINVRTDGTMGSSGSDNLYGVCFGFCL